MIFMILTLLTAMHRTQNLYEIVSYNDDKTETIDISLIDSITYTQSTNTYLQNIWVNGEKIATNISHSDSIVFNERYEYYPIISDDIQAGIVTNKGNHYCPVKVEKLFF